MTSAEMSGNDLDYGPPPAGNCSESSGKRIPGSGPGPCPRHILVAGRKHTADTNTRGKGARARLACEVMVAGRPVKRQSTGWFQTRRKDDTSCHQQKMTSVKLSAGGTYFRLPFKLPTRSA